MNPDDLIINTNYSDVTVSVDDYWSDMSDPRDEEAIKSMNDRLSAIESRLSILVPDKDMLEKYEILQEMYRTWPFMQSLLSNMDMVLAKSDMGIASRYAELVTDLELREEIFGRIKDEWERSQKWLFAITGNTELLQDNPTLMRSILNRTPYIDPLNHLQVELLRRYRSGDDGEEVKRSIHLTINGVSAGLRNSG
jgi:phosphoenolpyruvate carboxylase